VTGGDKLTLRDFIFSKEVRFGKYASLSSQPPGAIGAMNPNPNPHHFLDTLYTYDDAVVVAKALLKDEMAVPPNNWRKDMIPIPQFVVL